MVLALFFCGCNLFVYLGRDKNANQSTFLLLQNYDLYDYFLFLPELIYLYEAFIFQHDCVAYKLYWNVRCRLPRRITSMCRELMFLNFDANDYVS